MSAATSEEAEDRQLPNQCHGLKPSCSEMLFPRTNNFLESLGQDQWHYSVYLEDFGIFPISLWQSPWYQFIILESGLTAPKENCWRLPRFARLVTHCSFPRWRSRTKQCSRWKNSASLEARTWIPALAPLLTWCDIVTHALPSWPYFLHLSTEVWTRGLLRFLSVSMTTGCCYSHQLPRKGVTCLPFDFVSKELAASSGPSRPLTFASFALPDKPGCLSFKTKFTALATCPRVKVPGK